MLKTTSALLFSAALFSTTAHAVAPRERQTALPAYERA